nr:RodZ domain-containing protein [Caldimonas sp.]
MLTLVVLVPVVMLGMRPSTQTATAPAPDLAELDVLPPQRATTIVDATPPGAVAAQERQPDAAAYDAGPPVAEPQATAAPVPTPVRPVMASMAPLPESPVETPVQAAAPLAGRKVVLHLAQPSWVELTGAEGRRIEYALLPAGTVREYTIAGSANLRIGNSRGATLSVDGTAVDLAAHSRSNVARVELGAVPAER